MSTQQPPQHKKQKPTHTCEYWEALCKANKTITRKNRQIETLSKIISNLKSDIAELIANKQKHQAQLDALQQQIQQQKKQVQDALEKEQQVRKALSEQRLQHARRLRAVAANKRNNQHQNQYYSQCNLSRNSDMISQSPKCSQMLPQPSPSKQNPRQLTMGQLFMGRKAKLQIPASKQSMYGGWGRPELLAMPSYGATGFSKSRQGLAGGGAIGGFSVQNAINYLRMENEALKMGYR